MKKVQITYSEYGELLDEFADMLSKDEFAGVCGIIRGGLPIAVHLSHFLNIDLINENDLILDGNNYRNAGSILLVDDIVDTGKVMREIIVQCAGLPLKTAALYCKPHTTYKPDYYVRETVDWIVFPWERDI